MIDSNAAMPQQLELAVPHIKYEVVAEYPHDRKAYTEGLKFHQGYLYESTGVKGKSSLRQVELQTGDVLNCVKVNKNYFAEGLTILEGKIFQLTEDSRVGLVYDLNNLKSPAVEFPYKGWEKGWGLTDDGALLIMSDGSDQLRLIDPQTTELVGNPISVRANGNPCGSLNELERVGDYIYASLAYADIIVKIDRNDGNVIGQIDVAPLRPKETMRCVDCLANGIAFDNASNDFFITGKMWPALFRIRLLN